MWRREVIRLVLAANWIVFAISCNMVIAHGTVWRMNASKLVQAERAETPGREIVEWGDEESERAEVYRRRTEPLFLFGRNGWWLACGASLGTAVLLMIAFPKKAAT